MQTRARQYVDDKTNGYVLETNGGNHFSARCQMRSGVIAAMPREAVTAYQ